MNSDIVSLIIILICVMLSAYFSATETSFTSLNRIRMKNMAEKGDKRAELVLKLLENFDKLLSTILVGNNIVNIGLSSLPRCFYRFSAATPVRRFHDRNHYRGPDLRRSFPEKHCKRISGDDRQIFRTVSPHSDDRADPGDVFLFPVEEAALPHLQILGKPRHHR